MACTTACSSTETAIDPQGAASARRYQGTPVNIVLIVIDTIRKDHLQIYGHTRETSLNIDALGSRSSVYDRAYSQAPWTTPSIGALLSSRYPSSLGLHGLRSKLPESPVLLPELLRGAGYETAGFVSHSLCSARWGFAQGFDRFDESNIQGHLATTSQNLSDLAIEWLDADPRQPIFLFLHYFDPHFAYIDHREFPFGKDSSDYHGPVRSGVIPGFLKGAPLDLADADLREMKRIYDSEVAFTDHAVGKLLEYMRATGLFDDALIVLTGDHGEEFLDHGELGHTTTLYEELVNVPLIIKFPGGEPGRIDEPIALIDVYPTIVDYLGLPMPEDLAGQSLIASRSRERPRTIFMETSRFSNLRAVVEGNHKLIYDVDSRSSRLFDLGSDPGETQDVREDYPEVVGRLTLIVKKWMQENQFQSQPREGVAMTEEERERLRSLGYLP